MKILSIIPARMGSSRFPGKPLKLINGKPMIQYVFENSKKSKFIDKTIIATCDDEIKNFIISIGGEVIMTSKKHERASDRSYEAMIKLEKKLKKKFDIIVMIQGDEPMITSKMIDKSIKPLIKNKKIGVVNIVSKIKDKKEFNDKNCIKVVKDKDNNALYFSRSPIPFLSKINKRFIKKQVCSIPFRRDTLIYYFRKKLSSLEKIESIDMLRFLENGIKVKLVETDKYTHAVDTLSDIKKVQKLMKRK